MQTLQYSLQWGLRKCFTKRPAAVVSSLLVFMQVEFYFVGELGALGANHLLLQYLQFRSMIIITNIIIIITNIIINVITVYFSQQILSWETFMAVYIYIYISVSRIVFYIYLFVFVIACVCLCMYARIPGVVLRYSCGGLSSKPSIDTNLFGILRVSHNA